MSEKHGTTRSVTCGKACQKNRLPTLASSHSARRTLKSRTRCKTYLCSTDWKHYLACPWQLFDRAGSYQFRDQVGWASVCSETFWRDEAPALAVADVYLFVGFLEMQKYVRVLLCFCI